MRNQEQHVCSECKARRHVFTLDPNNYATNGPRHNKRAPGASQACGLPLSPTTVAVVVVVARLLALSPLFLHPPLSLLSPRPQLPFLLFPVYSTVPCHALRFPYIPRATPFFFSLSLSLAALPTVRHPCSAEICAFARCWSK